MIITQVTVSWQQTQSLPEYSNIKPGLTLTAQLQDGDNVDEVVLALRDQARRFVEEHIDEALERNDIPAKFSHDPRFDVYVHGRGTDRKVAIVPSGTFDAKQFYRTQIGHRISKAISLAQSDRQQGTELKIYLSAPFDELIAIDDALDAAFQVEREARLAAIAERRAAWPTTPDEDEDEDE